MPGVLLIHSWVEMGQQSWNQASCTHLVFMNIKKGGGNNLASKKTAAKANKFNSEPNAKFGSSFPNADLQRAAPSGF